MTHQTVAAVESLRVNPVELAHPLGEVRVRRLDHQVVVVPHEAERVADPVEIGHHSAEGQEEDMTVLVVRVDVLAPVSTGRDVVKRTGELETKRTGHAEVWQKEFY